jgi:AMMECR1 domain-containing protein
VSRFPFRLLARPLAPADRARLAGELERLLAWRRTLRGWPRVRFAPDATPFVALYAGGRLVGCCGSDEGAPRERLARAFVRALADRRAAALSPEQADCLAAQVCYLRAARPLDPPAAAAELEVGSDGVLALTAGAASVLLPQVARDGGLTPAQLLAALERKARCPLDGAPLFALRGDEVTAGDRSARADPIALARAWLAARVGSDGAVAHGIDSTGAALAPGEMHHGRAAAVVAALAASGHRSAARARRWLAREIERGLAGQPAEAWPEDPPRLAGTLALAHLAGVRCDGGLSALAEEPSLLGAPWHAAQVACALGAAAPPRLWRACVAALARTPWAPWTALAAEARGDGETRARAERALIDSLRKSAPHAGGAAVTEVPELALTALAVEALARSRGSVRRGLTFLRRWQILPGRRPAALSPVALGAFPASPVAALLRSDVTAHALTALLSARRSSR